MIRSMPNGKGGPYSRVISSFKIFGDSVTIIWITLCEHFLYLSSFQVQRTLSTDKKVYATPLLMMDKKIPNTRFWKFWSQHYYKLIHFLVQIRRKDLMTFQTPLIQKSALVDIQNVYKFFETTSWSNLIQKFDTKVEHRLWSRIPYQNRCTILYKSLCQHSNSTFELRILYKIRSQCRVKEVTDLVCRYFFILLFFWEGSSLGSRKHEYGILVRSEQ